MSDDPDVVPAATRRYALIGAGAVGTALGLRLAEAGLTVEVVVSRRPETAAALAGRLGARALPLEALPETVDAVLCCVPDDALAALAEALYLLPRPWTGTVVAHTSGVHGADVLAPLAARGALPLGFHPLQAFPPGSPPRAFEGIYIGLDGPPEAVAFGRTLARRLRAHPVEIPAGGRARYHLAAVLASNYLVTLMALAEEVLGSLGLDRGTSAAMLRPLFEGTWRNLSGHLPEDALTGPIVRGDRATVRRHLDTLAGDLPHLLPVYAALASETVRVAVRSGRLHPDDARALLDLLQEALDTPENPLF
ncbi:MAG: DUF2520 domain-containing protein [Bacteroidetes bacterium]|nr:MAG: DUF2520 domain-containing protein [Bacteroidota bacterium]